MPRSAAPLAAAGLIALGILPLLGGPGEPSHWATSAGVISFASLLLLRHRLRGPAAPLAELSEREARSAGRTLLIITGTICLVVAVIAIRRSLDGRATSPISLLLPLAALLWLGALGLRASRPPPSAKAWDRASIPGRESRT